MVIFGFLAGGSQYAPKWFQNRSRREPKLVQHGTQTGSQNGCPTVTVTRIARTRTHSHTAHRGHVGMGAQMVWKWFPKVVKVFTYAAAKSERFRALALCKMVPKWIQKSSTGPGRRKNRKQTSMQQKSGCRFTGPLTKNVKMVPIWLPKWLMFPTGTAEFMVGRTADQGLR